MRCGRSIVPAVSASSSTAKASISTTSAPPSIPTKSGASDCRRNGIPRIRTPTIAASPAAASPKSPAWACRASARICSRRTTATRTRSAPRSRCSARARAAWRAWPSVGTRPATAARVGRVRGQKGSMVGMSYQGLEKNLPDLTRPGLPPTVERRRPRRLARLPGQRVRHGDPRGPQTAGRHRLGPEHDRRRDRRPSVGPQGRRVDEDPAIRKSTGIDYCSSSTTSTGGGRRRPARRRTRVSITRHACGRSKENVVERHARLLGRVRRLPLPVGRVGPMPRAARTWADYPGSALRSPARITGSEFASASFGAELAGLAQPHGRFACSRCVPANTKRGASPGPRHTSGHYTSRFTTVLERQVVGLHILQRPARQNRFTILALGVIHRFAERHVHAGQPPQFSRLDPHPETWSS